MNRRLQYLILGADLMWIAAVCILTQVAQGRSIGNAPSFVQWLDALVALSIWSLLYVSKQLEGFRGGWHFPRVCAQVTVAVACLMSAFLILTFAFKQTYRVLGLFELGCLLSTGLIAIRCFARWLVDSRSNTGSKRRVIILGSGRIARELAARITHHPETSMEVVGLLAPSDAEPVRSDVSLRQGTVSVRTLNILTLMREERVRDLIVVEPIPSGIETSKLIANCQSQGVLVHLVPQRYELYVSKARLNEIDGIPLLSMEEQSLPILGMGLKRRMDMLGAGLLLILSAPLLVFITVGLYVNKGKVFLKERRCGKDGRPFWMHRLNVDRDAASLLAYERFLVRFSLTELPQLWNVLKGEMSLVGPRPESPDRVKHYSTWQRQRLSVNPGLTGLAQVHGLRERHSSEEKARFDLQYILHWSLFLDLSLLLQTIWILFVRLAEQEVFLVAPTSQRRPIINS